MTAEGVSPLTIETVKATVPVLQKHGIDIVTKFYDNLFEAYPSVRKQFNTDRHRGGVAVEGGVPKQVFSLANAVMAYAKNIDRVEVLLPVVETICHKHISRGVSPAQYDAVGECLIKAMEDVLGDAATDEFTRAWTEAYGFLSSVFIDTEKRIKAELEEKAGYSGFIPMSVVDIEEDEEGGKKLSLKPTEMPIPPHGVGQFLSFSIEKEGEEPTMTSMKIIIRDNEKDSLWIDVPRCEEKASRCLLEEVKVGSVLSVSMPCGKVKA